MNNFNLDDPRKLNSVIGGTLSGNRTMDDVQYLRQEKRNYFDNVDAISNEYRHDFMRNVEYSYNMINDPEMQKIISGVRNENMNVVDNVLNPKITLEDIRSANPYMVDFYMGQNVINRLSSKGMCSSYDNAYNDDLSTHIQNTVNSGILIDGNTTISTGSHLEPLNPFDAIAVQNTYEVMNDYIMDKKDPSDPWGGDL